MKVLIAILILMAAVFGFMQLVGVFDRSLQDSPPARSSGPADPQAVTGESLPGLPPYLEASLAEAQREGVEALGKWLKAWSKQVQDPRLAWIELDYVVLLNLRDHKAARERFLEVQARTPPTSPVFDRIEKLKSAYEH